MRRARAVWWSYASKALGIMGLLIVLSTVYLWYSFADSRPHAPDSKTGRVYRLNTHGNVVFLTRSESITLSTIQAMGIGCVLASIGIKKLIIDKA
jgi:hypothetical protein